MIELHVEPRCHTRAHFEVSASERGMLYADGRIVEHDVVITCAHKSLCAILRKEAKAEIMQTAREFARERTDSAELSNKYRDTISLEV